MGNSDDEQVAKFLSPSFGLGHLLPAVPASWGMNQQIGALSVSASQTLKKLKLNLEYLGNNNWFA